MLGVLRRSWALMGPAFLVSVAYMDPGNWATAIEAGSRFGYQLVWVVVLSNLIAILLQTLAARLGLVTGKHLAQICREAYPPVVCVLLWVLCEVSIVALDLTMVLGTAVGLNLLLGWPMLPCILLTSCDALLLLLLVPRHGVRTSESVTVLLVVAVLACFMVDLLLSAPPLSAVIGGLVPRLQRDSVYVAVCLLGANLMPHSFLLHSALVSGQAAARPSTSLSQLCLYNFLDIAAALGLALVVNVAVLLVAAATFHQAGIVVGTLQEAHDLMESLLSSRVAPAAFGLALLAAGQLSTFTGTIAGQVVLRGFMNINVSTWVRRLLTRGAAVLPAALLQALGGDRLSYRFLLMAQVVLALQLPFVLVPLIKATSSKQLMGQHRNSALLAAAAWASCGVVFVANLGLFVSELWPGAHSLVPVVEPDGPLESSLHHYLETLASLAWSQPASFVLVVALMLAAALLLALQLWVVVTPLNISSSTSSNTLLASKHAGTGSSSRRQGAAAAAAAQHHHQAAAAAAGGSGTHQHSVVLNTAAAGAAADEGVVLLHHPHHQQQQQQLSPTVSLNWSVPGVREWLLGSSGAAAAAGGGSSRGGDADAAACWSADASSPSRQLLHPRHGHRPPHLQQPPPFITLPASQIQLAALHGSTAAAAESHEEEQQPLLLLLPPTPSGVSAVSSEVSMDWAAGSEEGETEEQGRHSTAAAGTPGTQQHQQHQQRQHQRHRPQWVAFAPSSQQQQQQQPADSHPPPLPRPPASVASSSTSTTVDMDSLRADREKWLEWPQQQSAASTPRHSAAQHAAAAAGGSCRTSYAAAVGVPPRLNVAAAAAGLSAAQQQQQQQQQQVLPSPHPQPLQRVHSCSDASSVVSGVSAAGDGMSKSGRRQFAAVLESFWSAFFDSHGNWLLQPQPAAVTQAAAAAAGGVGRGRQHGSSNTTTSACCRCGGVVDASHAVSNHTWRSSGSSSVWCEGCCVGVLQHIRGCVQELQHVPGASKLQLDTAAALTPPPPQQQQQQQQSVDVTAAAAATLSQLWQQLPLGMQQHLTQHVQQQQPSSSSNVSSSSSSAPACLLSWGCWCILQLLALCQAEVRPELWGRYSLALNRLQGCLGPLTAAAAAGHAQQQQQQVAPLPCHIGTQPEVQRLVQLLLQQLQQLEGAVSQRKAPAGGGSAVGSAFAKGKEILMSVLKRYRRRLLLGVTTAGHQQQQQHGPWSSGGSSGGGGAAGSKRQHHSSSAAASPSSRSGGVSPGSSSRSSGRAAVSSTRLMLGMLLVCGVGLAALGTLGCQQQVAAAITPRFSLHHHQHHPRGVLARMMLLGGGTGRPAAAAAH